MNPLLMRDCRKQLANVINSAGDRMNRDSTSHVLPASEKQWDAGRYEHGYSFVWKHGADVIELLAPQAGERLLDLACGTGHLTAQLAARGAAVIGIDRSPEMIATARRNYPQLQFEI